MDNKKTIIILIAIIAILTITLSAFIFSDFGKEKSEIKIICNETMNKGDAIQIKLTDLNKTAIVNETINVKLIKGDETKEYNISTNENGIATLKLNNMSDGNYTINCTFKGNNKYISSDANKEFVYKNVIKSSIDPIDANRPTNDPTYRGYNPYHESERTSDGWNPAEHEVSRHRLSDGTVKIIYDDGYFRIVDENGYVITYGYQ